MTSFSDNSGAMGDEQSFDDPLLTDVLDELRSWGAQPAARPSAALAALFDATPAPPSRRRRQMITTKLAGLGLAAKVALGVGVATAAAATAGVTTGVLPNPLPAPAAKVTVDAGVDVSIPGVTPGAAHDDDHDADEGAGATGAHGAGAAAHPDNHGACVSEAAHSDTHTGRDHGQAVSAIAKSDCGKEPAAGPLSSTSTSTSTTSTTVEGGSSNRGPGNSNGNGNSGNAGNSANAGNGNPGRGNGNPNN